ncbi:helix-turn-helix domain-containing protein [Methylobacterium sp. P5_C11]
MLTWSTESLHPRDRFVQWREERARQLFGVSIELEPQKRLRFQGAYTLLRLGDTAIAELTASAYRVSRTPSDIARTPSDAFCICQQVAGGGLLKAGGREMPVAAGAIMMGQLDLSYESVPAPQDSFACRIVRLPASRITQLVRGGDAHPFRLLENGAGLSALFAAYLESFVVQAPHLTGSVAEAAIDTLLHLALLARGAGEPRADSARAAIRAGLLDRAHALIERRLHEPGLSPAQVAAALGISIRQLHILFEPTGTSFGRHLRMRRVARARRILEAAPRTSVTEAAYASGFDSLSTFFRSFRAAYGCAPGDVRP